MRAGFRKAINHASGKLALFWTFSIELWKEAAGNRPAIAKRRIPERIECDPEGRWCAWKILPHLARQQPPVLYHR